MCRFSTREQRRKLACAVRSAANSCLQVDNKITDPKLAKCIKEQCATSTIYCSTATPKGVGGNSAREDGIDIYVNNFGIDGSWGHYTAGDVVIHEFAEDCGWEHHKGKGVPDPVADFLANLAYGASSWGIKCEKRTY